jgi:hypothetical protein
MLYDCWSRRSVSLVLVPFLLLLAYGCKGDPQAKKAAHMQQGETAVAPEKSTEAIILTSRVEAGSMGGAGGEARRRWSRCRGGACRARYVLRLTEAIRQG